MEKNFDNSDLSKCLQEWTKFQFSRSTIIVLNCMVDNKEKYKFWELKD